MEKEICYKKLKFICRIIESKKTPKWLRHKLLKYIGVLSE